MITQSFAGSFKYKGKLVEGGFIDARSAARALNGIDSALRYFISQDNAELGSIDFPLPVQTRKGSWEAHIPNDLFGWIKAAATIVGTAYFTTVASKLAENGFKDETVASLTKKAMSRLVDLINIGKHVGHLSLEKIKGLRWDKEEMVGIPNEDGRILYVPVSSWQKLMGCPPNLISGIVAVVDEQRTLTVGVKSGRTNIEATITKKERRIFVPEEEDEEPIVLPELTNGLKVKLEGVVSRENGRSKTLGFYYDGHVITCMPASGNIVPYKKHLFLRCRMHGIVTRLDEEGNITLKKPKIIFTDLEILSDKEQMILGLEGADDE